MAEGLKPCPFCGGEAGIFYTVDKLLVGWFVGCNGKYDALCPGYVWKEAPLYYTPGQAAEAWNRRANDDSAAEHVRPDRDAGDPV